MILLIFPHQLFEKHPGLSLGPSRIILLEDSLFFGDAHYPLQFHKQKLWLHRATMKRYEAGLREQGFEVQYVEYDASDSRLDEQLKQTISTDERENETLSFDRSHRLCSGKATAAGV